MINLLELISRILLSSIFLAAGIIKIIAYPKAAAYMELSGVADWLLPIVIVSELALPIMIMIGWHTRFAAVALGLFTVLTALLFHVDFNEQLQVMMFMKNVAMAGGLLLLAVHGAGSLSIDHARQSKL